MHQLIKIALFICLSFVIRSQADHPIYFLLTHPRATATAFEKILRTHGELQVVHQPYLTPYLLDILPFDHPYRNSLPEKKTYDEVTDHIFKLAKDGPVFFKEQSYIVLDYLKDHPEFYLNPQVKFAFLVRDPAKSILSYYKKMPGVSNSIIGHEQLWELFVLLREKLGENLVVIDSDQLLQNPLPILQKLGESWNLTFSEEDIHWDKGYADDWTFKEWYVEVGDSTQLESYRGDVPRFPDGTPIYAEIEDFQTREHLQNCFRWQNFYYQKLLEYAVKVED